MDKSSTVETAGDCTHVTTPSLRRDGGADTSVRLICPLCLGSNSALVEQIKTRDLVSMVNKMLECDVSSEFGEAKEIGFYRCVGCDLQFFHPVVTGSETFYEKFQGFNWYYKNNKEEYEFARQFVKATDSVLEIGCGRGAFAKQIPARDYLGLEFSEEAIKVAVEDGVFVTKESIQAHAISNRDKYDFVCAFQVLEHVAENHAFITSSVACLKPGGLLVYSVPGADSFLAIGTNAVTNLPPHHVTRWSDQCLRKVADIFGMRLVALEHEKMGDHQKRMFASLVILNALESLTGTGPMLVNRTLKHRALNKVANAAARVLERGFRSPWVVPHGASVTAVYQKG